MEFELQEEIKQIKTVKIEEEKDFDTSWIDLE